MTLKNSTRNDGSNTVGDAQVSSSVARLTDKERWRYVRQSATRKNIDAIKRREEWLSIVENLVPKSDLSYLELGCAPGQYTAALAESTAWNVSGIDYSADAELFKETMAVIGKEATLYQIDMFEEQVKAKFDIVTSIGLVEHFRASLLDEVFALHDGYAKPGGYVVIMVPNFTGLNYLWHYVFDRPDLDRHNIDVMQPVVFDWFREKNYEVLYNDYVGVMRLWGNSGWTRYWILGKGVAAIAVGLSKVALLLDKLGLHLRGRSWSPSLLFIARKKS